MAKKPTAKLTRADRDAQIARASSFKYQTKYALTILCADQADQERLFQTISKRWPNRQIRVVVS